MASPTIAFIKLFRSIDLDLDNRVTEEDLLRHQAKEGFSDTFAKRWLKMFDKNNDGIIELEDFCLELGMTQAEAEEQMQMTATMKVHSAKPPTPQPQRPPSMDIPLEEEEITVEVMTCEMPTSMQESTIEIVSKAAEKYDSDERKMQKYIEECLKKQYNFEWEVNVDPMKKHAPDSPWNYMIYFRMGRHTYMVSDKKQNGCGCCYFCCL